MRFAMAAVCSGLLVAPAAAQWLQHPTSGLPRTADRKPNLAAPAPRTADGKPDFTGLWSGPPVGMATVRADPKGLQA